MAPASTSLVVFAALAFGVGPLAAAPSLVEAVEFGPSPRADADSPSSGPSSGETQDPDADADSGTRTRAKQAFDEGMSAIANGEYELAVANFERAYGLSAHPVTLFNLALALEKAKRLPEAWGLFDHIIDVVESNAERRELRRHMQSIEAQIAIIEINAQPNKRLCIDGLDMPKGETSDYRLAIEPGRHDMLLDEHAFSIDLRAGDRRMLLLERSQDLIPSERGSVLTPAMVGTAIGTGSLALALGIGAAAAKDDRVQTGLAASSATSAGLAVAASVVVLLLETRVISSRARTDQDGSKRKAVTCPGSPRLERRLDLRIGPQLGRPAEFAAAPPTAMSAMSAMSALSASADEFPHPHTIQPPRNSM
jgi:hypothetical protein